MAKGPGGGRAAARSNPTVLRTAGGGRLAGQRTVDAAGRLRNARNSLMEGLRDARANYQAADRRRARR